MRPFRWDVSKAEQLGRLVDPEHAGPDPEWVARIVEAAVKVVARSDNARLVFVGRSPENFFDYLSGVFAGTGHAQRIHHLNLSNRGVPFADIRAEAPDAYAGLCAHMTELRLDPASIAGGHGVCFVDLVATGGTFGHLFALLHDWAVEIGVDPKKVVANIRFVGITSRTKTSPNTHRWQQQESWVKDYGVTQIKNVSISRRLWDQLGNAMPKVTPSNTPQLWGPDALLGPDRAEDTLRALQLAHSLYRLGTEQRREFGRMLDQTEAAKLRWARDLMAELRR